MAVCGRLRGGLGRPPQSLPADPHIPGAHRHCRGGHYSKMREWLEKAANKGDPASMSALGLLYEAGQGAPNDYTKARELFEKAADKGNAEAMRNLGLIYGDGLGMEPDYSKAREWLEKAANKGDAISM